MPVHIVRLVRPFLLLFILVTSLVQAEESQTPSLLQKLQQRDQVIIELLERVEVLEKELGVQPARSKKREKPDTDTQTQSQLQTINKDAPGVVVVDENMAERALERSLTRDGVLLLPSGVFEIEPRFAYARQENSTPSFVMSGGNVISSETERNSDSVTTGLSLRIGLPRDSQLEIGIPYRWRRTETVTNVNFVPIETSTRSGNGFGDVRITYAKTLLSEDTTYPDVIGRLTWDTDTGEISDNGISLGGGFHEIQASLSFIKREDPVVFVSGLSYEYTFEENEIKPGATIAANVGSYIALSPQTSLNLVLALAYDDETKIAGNAIEGSDRVIGTLIVGGSTLISRGTLLNLSVGVGLTDDADDFSITVSLPIRFF